ncbi:MAG: ATP-dependent helicase UvrD/PcrA [Acidobacteriota bacterium]|jgi:DNA helicase-2/ATP-dependent DNA helicase PcrA|nr:ATP-dependent helicase UvrD/PcrA [Acidobacteriota bacterium]
MKVLPEETSIAHYRILESLGAGGMGEVYKAYDEKLHRVVALKLLPPEAVSHEDRRRRFLQEARAASALNHPHILTVYEVGEVEGRPYIAMEYIEGETLRQKIKSGALQVKEVLDIALQVAEGLAKAHERGIIHRDLKPENLMISRDGYAKILDFGLAKLIKRQPPGFAANSAEKTLIRVKTQSGMIMGTVNYMSPEQLLGQRVDLRSDIFSFGIILYEMSVGRCPFVNENQIDTMHAILHEELKPPQAFKSGLPLDLQRILAKALAKAPKGRYQTVRELSAELKSLQRDLELGKVALAPAKTRLVLKRLTTLPSPRVINYEKELNESQYKAVITTAGPLLIVAGAGTGKTRTLVYRMARLVEMGVQPESVMLLTFTRRAATSMLSRAAALADERCQRVSGGTFHSMAHSVLRKFPEMAGVERSFTVLDSSDTEDLIDLLRRQMHLTRDRHFPRKRTICAIFSMLVNKVLSIEEVLDQCYPQFADERPALEELFDAFDEFKRGHHMLTYDDLLSCLREALEANAELCQRLSEQYRYLMVDEYQDTNKLQAQIVRLMAAAHDNVAVVGDECQSIYSFRGASFKNMLEFPDIFPGAQIIKLEENFRSTQPILNVANAIISDVKEGYAKRLFSQASEGSLPTLVSAHDENEQSRFVAERIEELREEGVPLHEISVLFRASSHSFDLEIELSKHGIPFRKFGGIKFAESAHIKDALAFLRVVANPADTLSWFRTLKLIDHIGDATVEQILSHLGVERKNFKAQRTKGSLFKKLAQFPARASYKDSLNRLARLLGILVEEKSPAVQLSTALRFYRPILKARYDDYPRRQRDLEHLQAIAKRYKSAAELLADVALDPSDAAQANARGGGGGGYVTLSTVHSAKGLEWGTLFVIWMTDGWFPSSRSYDEFDDLEEERRLLYVAATRAKQHLYFTYPLNTYRSTGTDSFPAVSRFLESIPHAILNRATLLGESNNWDQSLESNPQAATTITFKREP